MKPVTLEQFVLEKGAEIKAELDPTKNKPNVERLAGVAVIGLRWMLEGMMAELEKKPRQ